MGSLKTALPVGLGGILAKQQDVFRHPDNGQRCRISLLRLGYIFVFLCGLFTLGFGEIGEASRFSFFSGTRIAVDEEVALKVMANSSQTPMGHGWGGEDGGCAEQVSLEQIQVREWGGAGGSGNSLTRSALPNFNDKEGWASCRLLDVPFHQLTLKGGAVTRSLEVPQEGVKGRGRRKRVLPLSPEGKGVS